VYSDGPWEVLSRLAWLVGDWMRLIVFFWVRVFSLQIILLVLYYIVI
jgi:hypothetical protein